MKKQQLILTNSQEVFQEKVDSYTAQGWMIVPGSLSITEGRTGYKWFVCVVEGGESVASNGKPLEEMIEEIAAVSGVAGVQILYQPHIERWSVHLGILGKDEYFTVIESITGNPHQSLAAALIYAQKRELDASIMAVC